MIKKSLVVIFSLGLMIGICQAQTVNNKNKAVNAAVNAETDGTQSQAEQNKQTIINFYNAAADKNDNNIQRFFATHYKLVDLGAIKDVGSTTVKNLDVYKRIDNIRKAFPDFTIKINDIFATNNKVFADVSLSGHQRGQFLGIAPTNKPINLRWFVVFDMQNGKIVKSTQLDDEFSMMKQLGYVILTK